jgi:hypothetical protein
MAGNPVPVWAAFSSRPYPSNQEVRDVKGSERGGCCQHPPFLMKRSLTKIKDHLESSGVRQASRALFSAIWWLSLRQSHLRCQPDIRYPQISPGNLWDALRDTPYGILCGIPLAITPVTTADSYRRKRDIPKQVSSPSGHPHR